MTTLNINGIAIAPGERLTIMLPTPKLYDWTPLNMPVHIIRGKKSGPVLCVTAAIHGDEINGIEIIRRLLKKPILKDISGTLIAAPIVNVYGFLYQNRYLMDRRDLNRSFPGSNKGSLAARLCQLIMKELVSHATHFIDLHTGSLHRSNLPQIRANLDMPGLIDLATAFNVPVVLHAKEPDGSLRQAANDKGIPFLLYEAGEALRFEELSIRVGVRGILGVMHALNMIKIEGEAPPKEPAFARSSFWVRAAYSGILKPYKTLGNKIKKGDLLGIIANPMGNEEYPVKAPFSGIVIGKNNLPLVHEGAALFNIAYLKKNAAKKQPAELIEEENIDPLGFQKTDY